MLTRRQFIEYKLKYIQKAATDPNETAEMSRAEALASKSALLTELSALQGSIEVAIRDYEQQFGERFVRPSPSTPGQPMGNALTPDSGRPTRQAPHYHDREGGVAGTSTTPTRG